MKKLIFYILVISLLVIPAVSIYYKTAALDLPLLPPQAEDGWILQFEIRPDRDPYSSKVFPLPVSDAHQTIKGLKLSPESVAFTQSQQEAGTLLNWEGSKNQAEVLRASMVVHLKHIEMNPLKAEGSLGPLPKRFRHYRVPPVLSPTAEAQLSQLESGLFTQNDDPIGRLRTIYYWITEEILLNSEVTDLEEGLLLNSGSRLVRAQLFTTLARRAGLPARTVAAIRLRSPSKEGTNHQSLTFYNEVYIDSAWYPVDVNRGSFGRLSDDLIVLYKNWESLEDTVAQRGSTYSILAEPMRTDRLNTESYVDSLDQTESFLSIFSFHKLPLSMQAMFYSILFLPFGAVVLSFARNMVGVQTFGIFTPILLTLFFIETSLEFGLIFFSLIIVLGFIQRYVLDRFYLLAVPRLSILLTLVIMTFGAIALLDHEYGFLPSGGHSLGYFPIVITTVFIERFSIHFIEEGTWNTMRTLGGTFFVAVLCFLLFQMGDLKLLIFTHPELLLVAISLFIMIGSYKGYRLSEFFRFKDLSRTP